MITPRWHNVPCITGMTWYGMRMHNDGSTGGMTGFEHAYADRTGQSSSRENGAGVYGLGAAARMATLFAPANNDVSDVAKAAMIMTVMGKWDLQPQGACLILSQHAQRQHQQKRYMLNT